MVAGRRSPPTRCLLRVRFPASDGTENGNVSPTAAHWDAELGEYILDWDDVRQTADPHATAVEFGRSVIRHACTICNWDQDLAASADASPPPII